MNGDSNPVNGWRIVPNESWREIVAEYADRIQQIRDYDPWNRTVPKEPLLGAREVACPFVATDDPRVLVVAKRLSLFCGTTAFVAIQSAQTICDLWESGRFVLVPLNTRFVLESWSRMHYAVDVLNKMVKTGNIDKAEEWTERLTFGTRSEITFPWGGKGNDVKAIHINDCLCSLQDVLPEYKSLYAFLSESSHPSFTENMYFMMAGPPISNWNNVPFRETMKPMIEKCLTILERSIEGVLADFSLIASLESVVVQIYRSSNPP